MYLERVCVREAHVQPGVDGTAGGTGTIAGGLADGPRRVGGLFNLPVECVVAPEGRPAELVEFVGERTQTQTCQ